jgi:hypothetical protein
VHEPEDRLIPDRVVGPDFGHVHLVFGGQPARDFNGSRGDVEMKRRSGAAKVGPLCARFEVVDRLGRFDLDGTHELPASIGRGQDQVRKYLQLADFDRCALVLADVRGHVVPPLQLHLKEPDYAIVFELLANWTNEDRAHLTSESRRITGDKPCWEPPIIDRFARNCITDATEMQGSFLTWMSFPLRMMR